MDHQDAVVLRDLLTNQRILSLAVLVDGGPYASLLPYGLRPDYGAAYIHASRLARHTLGLEAGAPFSVLIHGPDSPKADPLQIPRVTLQGEVAPLDKQSEAYERVRELYLARFPGAGMTFELGDFNLYELTFKQGRLVVGFARATNVSREELASLAGS